MRLGSTSEIQISNFHKVPTIFTDLPMLISILFFLTFYGSKNTVFRPSLQYIFQTYYYFQHGQWSYCFLFVLTGGTELRCSGRALRMPWINEAHCCQRKLFIVQWLHIIVKTYTARRKKIWVVVLCCTRWKSIDKI